MAKFNEKFGKPPRSPDNAHRKVLQSGRPPPPVADEKSLDASVNAALAAQARKPAYKPAPDHPWRKT